MNKRQIILIAHSIILLLILTCNNKNPKNQKWLLGRIWDSNIIKNESLFFIQENSDEPPKASLLFQPKEIIYVKSATEEITYIEGEDYVITPDSREIYLLKNSKIPFKEKKDIYPPIDSPKSIKKYRFGNKNLFFSEGHVFHDLQVAVTYKHKDKWEAYIPEFAGEYLPNSLNKLRKSKTINLVLFGDSISNGSNASGFKGAPPYMPPYGILVALNLEYVYKSKVNFTNHSVGGTRTKWGIENINNVIADNPDLVIIAFGMNDASGNIPPEEYSENIQEMIRLVKNDCNNTEFILIATMTGNPEWSRSSPELYLRYRDELMKLRTKGIEVVDMTSVWTELLKYKKFADITGNGVNHPNDFGHRLYAEFILGLLVE